MFPHTSTAFNAVGPTLPIRLSDFETNAALSDTSILVRWPVTNLSQPIRKPTALIQASDGRIGPLASFVRTASTGEVERLS